MDGRIDGVFSCMQPAYQQHNVQQYISYLPFRKATAYQTCIMPLHGGGLLIANHDQPRN